MTPIEVLRGLADEADYQATHYERRCQRLLDEALGLQARVRDEQSKRAEYRHAIRLLENETIVPKSACDECDAEVRLRNCACETKDADHA